MAEEICDPDFTGEYWPETSHKDYIKGFMEQMDMVCWSKSKIAFMAQIYFVGFSARIMLLPLGEKIGLVRFIKFVVIPVNILSYTLGYQAQSYAWRCVGFFFLGISRIKMITGILILKT